MKPYKRTTWGSPEVLSTIAIVVCLVVLAFFGARSQGLLLVDVDQQSHLNFARLVTDSITPGVSQLGFWPPLLHAVLAPFASFDTLYFSGTAGLFAVLPFFFLAAFFMFSFVRDVTGKTNPAIFSVLLFASSPYILYYSITPMMEIPFFALFLGSLYFLRRWLIDGKLLHVLLAAVLVSLAILARFEGFALIPGFVVIFLYRTWKARTSLRQSSALASLLLPLLLGGVGAILLYGSIYASNPLEFLNGKWSASAQEKFLDLPSQGDIHMTLMYFIEAARDILGFDRLLQLLTLFTLGAGLIALFTKEERGETLLLGVYSFLPSLFVLYSLYTGHTVIYTENLPPYKGYFNVRYGLIVLPPLILWATVFLGSLKEKFWSRVSLFLGWWMVILSLLFFVQVISGSFPLIAQGTKDVQPWNKEQKMIAEALCKDSDNSGLTLFTRATMNNVPVAGCLPLSRFILESNDPYYDMAIERPWFFAEHVILLKKGINAFAYENDRVTTVWGDKPLFTYFYDVVEETDRMALYRLNTDHVRAYAEYFSLDAKAIPTLVEGGSTVLSRDIYKTLGLRSAEELVARDDEFLSRMSK